MAKKGDLTGLDGALPKGLGGFVPLEKERVLRCTGPLRVQAIGMDPNGNLVVEGDDPKQVYSIRVHKDRAEGLVLKVARVSRDTVRKLGHPVAVEVPCPPIDMKPQCEVVKWSRSKLDGDCT